MSRPSRSRETPMTDFYKNMSRSRSPSYSPVNLSPIQSPQTLMTDFDSRMSYSRPSSQSLSATNLSPIASRPRSRSRSRSRARIFPPANVSGGRRGISPYNRLRGSRLQHVPRLDNADEKVIVEAAEAVAKAEQKEEADPAFSAIQQKLKKIGMYAVPIGIGALSLLKLYNYLYPDDVTMIHPPVSPDIISSMPSMLGGTSWLPHKFGKNRKSSKKSARKAKKSARKAKKSRSRSSRK